MSDFDGGPAFPVIENFDMRKGEYLQRASPGMSLRDYFAVAAIPLAWEMECEAQLAAERTYNGVAVRAYHMADAMLRVRGNDGES